MFPAWIVFSHKPVAGAANGTEELFAFDVTGNNDDVEEVTGILKQDGHTIQAILPPDEPEPDQGIRFRRRR